jgi:phage terminase large subunit
MGVIIEDLLSQEQSNAFHCLGGHDETRFAFQHLTRVIYGGQAGGGKSFLICLWLDSMCNKYAGTRYYMARERLKDIKESVLLTFWDVLASTKSKVHYNDNKSNITYANGSCIYLVDCFAYPSDPNFDSMGSREYTAGAIEEGITVTERAADILISRTRYKHDEFGLTPKQLITCNPGEGWIKDKIVLPYLKGKKMQKNEVFIRATLQSNPNKKFREMYEKTLLENLGEFDRARLLHGDWEARIKTGAEYLKEFSQDKHVGDFPYNPLLPLHISFDENVNPYITCLLWQVDKLPGKEYFPKQIGEICMPPPNNTRQRVCNEIIRRYPAHKTGMFIYGDATSRKNDTAKEYGENFFTDILKFLERYHPSLRLPTINPPVVGKGGFLNLILEKKYRGIGFGVDRHCSLSISDYAGCMEDMEGGIDKKRVTNPDTGVSYEKFGHATDAMTYLFCELFANDFNYYLSGGQAQIYEVGSDRDYTFQREF